MPGTDSSDIFMMFTHDGHILHGESTTQLQIPGRPPSPLLKGFVAGRIFEIHKFSLGFGVNQEDPDNTIAMQKALAKLDPTFKPNRGTAPKQPTTDSAAAQKKSSPVTPQPITFVRSMDKASHALLYHVIKRTYFSQVSIVKRKSAGTLAAGEAYMRMDFNGVILVEANWSNEDPIEETYKFQARAISMRYCPQLPDGSLGAPVPGFWSMAPDARQTT
jgi:type VI protein secretion system component Hcp